MEHIDRYLNKLGALPIGINTAESSNLDIIVVIPAYDESFESFKPTIDSLVKAEKHDLNVAVYILFNAGPGEDMVVNKNQDSLDQINSYVNGLELSGFQILTFIHCFASRKRSGVGPARKLLMDIALQSFQSLQKDGIIVNLDADTTIAEDYFVLIDRAFAKWEGIEAMGLSFAHTWIDKDDLNLINAIVQYELHLRYFINMQRWCELPYAFQTIGSAMACRASAYAKEGGMVQRQAGEDFYFLHKFIRKNNFRDLNEAFVYPSSRRSHRVPFGTGKAVADQIRMKQEQRLTYNPESFIHLNQFLDLESIYELDEQWLLRHILKQFEGLQKYLQHIQFLEHIRDIKGQTKSFQAFCKRFYRWFDAFILMKYLHYMRENGYPDVKIDDATAHLFKLLQLNFQNQSENLSTLRALDSRRDYFNEVQA